MPRDTAFPLQVTFTSDFKRNFPSAYSLLWAAIRSDPHLQGDGEWTNKMPSN